MNRLHQISALYNIVDSIPIDMCTINMEIPMASSKIVTLYKRCCSTKKFTEDTGNNKLYFYLTKKYNIYKKI